MNARDPAATDNAKTKSHGVSHCLLVNEESARRCASPIEAGFNGFGPLSQSPGPVSRSFGQQ
jgi:hypothetical protein